MQAACGPIAVFETAQLWIHPAQLLGSSEGRTALIPLQIHPVLEANGALSYVSALSRAMFSMSAIA
jgi:hypothetical protein